MFEAVNRQDQICLAGLLLRVHVHRKVDCMWLSHVMNGELCHSPWGLLLDPCSLAISSDGLVSTQNMLSRLAMDGNVYAWKTFKDESVVNIWRKIYTPWIIERVLRNNRTAQSLPTAVKEAVQFSYMGALRSVPCE